MRLIPINILAVPLITVPILTSCLSGPSDETVLREEFAIPSTASLIEYQAHPPAKAVMREGLSIHMVFQLTDQDYAAYLAQVEAEGTWQPLPIPSSFLNHMGSIQSRKASIEARYQVNNEPLPEEGSVYNPTKEQLLDQFISSLPTQPDEGLFQIRSAGDNILYAANKTIHTQLGRDLNDFMLVMLDHPKQQIIIQVSSSY